MWSSEDELISSEQLALAERELLSLLGLLKQNTTHIRTEFLTLLEPGIAGHAQTLGTVSVGD